MTAFVVWLRKLVENKAYAYKFMSGVDVTTTKSNEKNTEKSVCVHVVH